MKIKEVLTKILEDDGYVVSKNGSILDIDDDNKIVDWSGYTNFKFTASLIEVPLEEALGVKIILDYDAWRKITEGDEAGNFDRLVKVIEEKLPSSAENCQETEASTSLLFS